jgi:amidophosphoribosyltransferase
MVRMLRESGVTEVHMRISSPPYRWPCHYGMDTGSRGELLAANMTVEEIREYLEVDTLSYLGLDRLVEATGATNAGFCDACLSGVYPVAVPESDHKHVLEAEPVSPQRAVPVQLLVESELPADQARSGGVDGG